jgi:hypothetical protein
MKFKDKATGCVYEFLYEHDIAQMLKHPQYGVVNEQVIVEKEIKEVEPVKKGK